MFDIERNELDTDMESSGMNNGANVSHGFGGLGFGSSSATKTDQTPSKGLFGNPIAPTPSLFGQATNTTAQGQQQQQQQVKSPFGGILKTATLQAAIGAMPAIGASARKTNDCFLLFLFLSHN